MGTMFEVKVTSAVNRHICTAGRFCRGSYCWHESMLGKQRGRDPGWKPMSKIRWPIYWMHNVSSRVQRAYGGNTKCTTLHIDSKSIRRGVSRWCVNTKSPGACSQTWPALQLVLVPKPTKGLESREGRRFLHRFRAVENSGPFGDSLRCDWPTSLRIEYFEVSVDTSRNVRCYPTWNRNVLRILGCVLVERLLISLSDSFFHNVRRTFWFVTLCVWSFACSCRRKWIRNV